MEAEIWTPLKLLKWTADYFTRRGVDDARLDAELLLSKVLGVDRIMLYAGFERIVSPEELARFREMVRQRAAGRPAKYIIGRTEFHSLAFAVDERVLIPRPETELLVERALALLAAGRGGEPPRVVEIGTGSGAIAVSLAVDFPDATYIATDVSGAALDVARANADANHVAQRIEFLEGDLFAPLRAAGLEGKVALMVSNPPYVSESAWQGLAREIREYEPKIALVPGPAGVEVHGRLIEGAGDFLVPGGALLVEMDSEQKDCVAEIAARRGGWGPVEFHQDYARLWRFYELVKA